VDSVAQLAAPLSKSLSRSSMRRQAGECNTMSSVAVPSGFGRTAALFNSVVGKKIVMAVTGLILFGFVTVHMIGNLQIYLGPDRINAYGKFLQENVELLWPARIILLTCVVLHILAAWQLTILNNFKARPVAYAKKTALASTYAARTMVWSGPILACFIVYHILHFTTLQAYPGVAPDDVYNKVIYGFQRQPAAAVFYIIANILLATHLYHGVWSLFQTLGVSHPRYTPWIKAGARVFGFVIGIGNCSIPLAVLLKVLPRTL
jgi:succinate dehydrogenase / fumarate reductase cytochrome b subunit